MIETGAAAGVAGKAAAIAGFVGIKKAAAIGCMPFFLVTHGGGKVAFNWARFLEIVPLCLAIIGLIKAAAGLYAEFQVMHADLVAMRAELTQMRNDIYAPRFNHDFMGPRQP